MPAIQLYKKFFIPILLVVSVTNAVFQTIDNFNKCVKKVETGKSNVQKVVTLIKPYYYVLKRKYNYYAPPHLRIAKNKRKRSKK